MSEYYTRTEIQGLFDPPVSKHYLICLQKKKRIPEPIGKIDRRWVYDKKQIDQWLLTGVEKENRGRKAGEKQLRMSNEDFDPWNLRGRKTQITFTEEMTNVIMFLQPNLKNRYVGNSL